MLPMLIIIIFAILLVLVTELVLKVVAASEASSSFSNVMGPNGTNVPYLQAWHDSGCYPSDYLTEEIWNEMKLFHKERERQHDVVIPAELKKLGGNFTNVPKGYRRYMHVNIEGQNFSIPNGFRGTTDQESVLTAARIFIFGGSTVFCDEMPDKYTSASFLQRLINQEERQFKIINCGWCGATVLERIEMLKNLVKPNSGDKVIFYFGVNDSGFTSRNENKIPLPIRFLKFVNVKYGIELAGWLYAEVSPQWMCKYAGKDVDATISELANTYQYCKSKGVEILVILQPNLYTLRKRGLSEIRTMKRFPILLKKVILCSYRRYEEWVKETPFTVSATHIFDNTQAPVFLDWAHVNARGNEIIAKFIYEELQRRGMLSSNLKL